MNATGTDDETHLYFPLVALTVVVFWVCTQAVNASEPGALAMEWAFGPKSEAVNTLLHACVHAGFGGLLLDAVFLVWVGRSLEAVARNLAMALLAGGALVAARVAELAGAEGLLGGIGPVSAWVGASLFLPRAATRSWSLSDPRLAAAAWLVLATVHAASRPESITLVLVLLSGLALGACAMLWRQYLWANDTSAERMERLDAFEDTPAAVEPPREVHPRARELVTMYRDLQVRYREAPLSVDALLSIHAAAVELGDHAVIVDCARRALLLDPAPPGLRELVRQAARAQAAAGHPNLARSTWFALGEKPPVMPRVSAPAPRANAPSAPVAASPAQGTRWLVWLGALLGLMMLAGLVNALFASRPRSLELQRRMAVGDTYRLSSALKIVLRRSSTNAEKRATRALRAKGKVLEVDRRGAITRAQLDVTQFDVGSQLWRGFMIETRPGAPPTLLSGHCPPEVLALLVEVLPSHTSLPYLDDEALRVDKVPAVRDAFEVDPRTLTAMLEGVIEQPVALEDAALRWTHDESCGMRLCHVYELRTAFRAGGRDCTVKTWSFRPDAGWKSTADGGSIKCAASDENDEALEISFSMKRQVEPGIDFSQMNRN